MQITIELPNDIAQRNDPAREALEALVIEGYRSGALTAYQARRILGFETGGELDGFLKAHEVLEYAYGVDELQQDRCVLASLDQKQAVEKKQRS